MPGAANVCVNGVAVLLTNSVVPWVKLHASYAALSGSKTTLCWLLPANVTLSPATMASEL